MIRTQFANCITTSASHIASSSSSSVLRCAFSSATIGSATLSASCRHVASSSNNNDNGSSSNSSNSKNAATPVVERFGLMTELSLPRSRHGEVRQMAGFATDEVDPSAPVWLVSFHRGGQRRMASTSSSSNAPSDQHHAAHYEQTTPVSQVREAASSAVGPEGKGKETSSSVEKFAQPKRAVVEKEDPAAQVERFRAPDSRVNPVLEKDGVKTVQPHKAASNAVSAELERDGEKRVEPFTPAATALSPNLEKNAPHDVAPFRQQ